MRILVLGATGGTRRLIVRDGRKAIPSWLVQELANRSYAATFAVATEETKFQVTTVCANAATAHDCDWSITRVGFPDLEIMINEQVAEEQKSKASDAMIVSVQIRSSQKPSQRDFCAAINQTLAASLRRRAGTLALEYRLDLTDTVYRGAVESLRRCCCPAGFKASGSLGGYQQIWARDSMISLLGARLIDDDQIQTALHASLSTLKRHQTEDGEIPNNVDWQMDRPNFRAYADGGLWWIIGSTLLAPDLPTVRSIHRWYACQDVDASGLIQMQESADWQDLFCTRGKGLYLNCLYVLALRAAAKQAESSDEAESRRYLRRADLASEQVNSLFWYRGDGNLIPHIAHTFTTEGLQDTLGRKRWLPQKRYLVDQPYYLPYLAFRAAGEWFDSLGNLLAILSGVADAQRSGTILDFIERQSLHIWPLGSLTPVIRPGDPDWRDYYGTLNLPHQYHNGGVWPFIGGFYVAALVKAGRQAAAEKALENLAALNDRGRFNEWHHGETGLPMGVTDQAWSAAMYVFAYECVRSRQAELV